MQSFRFRRLDKDTLDKMPTELALACERAPSFLFTMKCVNKWRRKELTEKDVLALRKMLAIRGML